MEGRLERQSESSPQEQITYNAREVEGRSLFRLGRKVFVARAEVNGLIPGLGSAEGPETAWTEKGAIRSAEKGLRKISPSQSHNPKS